MNIVFFGSSLFSLHFLQHLFLNRKDNLTVITTPDKPRGRGFKILSNSIKEFCLKNGLKFYQYEDINSLPAKQDLNAINADLFLVVAFGQRFSKETLEIPRLFSMNIHASFLPKYRGAAPINWAIIKGEKQTGISIIKMEEKIDAGPVILQKKLDIDDRDDVSALTEKLICLGKEMLIEALEKIESNNVVFMPQDEKEASFAPRLKKKDGLIFWEKPAQAVYNLIRGCYGWPSAFTYYKKKLLKIHKAEYIKYEGKAKPGEIVDVAPEGILVACAQDGILIKELQLESKRRMPVEDFLCGYKINIGEKLG